MTGRNIKVHGHAMRRPDPNKPYRWECYCGAWSGVLPHEDKSAAQLRRDGHDEHKMLVLRKRGDWEEDENG